VSEALRDPSRSHARSDLLLVLVAASLAVVLLGASLAAPLLVRAPVASRPAVGKVRWAQGALQARAARTLGWAPLRAGDAVHDGDALFAPPGVAAGVELDDGTRLELDERSLVVVEPSQAGRAVTLRQGALTGEAGAQGLILATPAGPTQLVPGTNARVELTAQGVSVAVTRGRATVGGAKPVVVEAHQRAAATAQGAQLQPAWPVRLTHPEAGSHRYFERAPAPLVLAWEGDVPQGARVQVAVDRMFAFVAHDEPATGGQLELLAPEPGVTWWRLVDARGQAVSEAHRFAFIEDRPPVPLSPGPNEVVLAPKGTPLRFAFAVPPGNLEAQVEVSAFSDFHELAMVARVQESQVKLASTLPEGAWYWRARLLDDAGPRAASPAVAFRVIHKGIPAAPELLNPELEVTP
jgi:hypothetical protein